MTETISSNARNAAYLYQSENWIATSNRSCVIDDINCAMWIALRGHSTDGGNQKVIDLYNLLDEKIDGSDGELAGSIRLYSNSISAQLYYKNNQYTLR